MWWDGGHEGVMLAWHDTRCWRGRSHRPLSQGHRDSACDKDWTVWFTGVSFVCFGLYV